MIRKILTTYAARLDEYLARSHRQPEGVAEVGLIGSAGEQCPNKLVVSLVNLEREASGDVRSATIIPMPVLTRFLSTSLCWSR